MKFILKLFILLFFLCVAGMAQAREVGGQYMTVRVSAVPESVRTVQLAFQPDGEEVQLTRSEDGDWVGSFVLADRLFHELCRPRVVLRDSLNRPLAAKPSLSMASSELTPATLALALEDNNLRFVCDQSVALGSVRLLTLDGKSTFPQVSGRTFALPRGLAPEQILAITADSNVEKQVVLEPVWDADLATVEDN